MNHGIPLRPAMGKQIFKMAYSCHSDCKSRTEGFRSIYVGLCRKHSLFVLYIMNNSDRGALFILKAKDLQFQLANIFATK